MKFLLSVLFVIAIFYEGFKGYSENKGWINYKVAILCLGLYILNCGVID